MMVLVITGPEKHHPLSHHSHRSTCEVGIIIGISFGLMRALKNKRIMPWESTEIAMLYNPARLAMNMWWEPWIRHLIMVSVRCTSDVWENASQMNIIITITRDRLLCDDEAAEILEKVVMTEKEKVKLQLQINSITNVFNTMANRKATVIPLTKMMKDFIMEMWNQGIHLIHLFSILISRLHPYWTQVSIFFYWMYIWNRSLPLLRLLCLAIPIDACTYLV